jgi:hypothetical protein
MIPGTQQTVVPKLSDNDAPKASPKKSGREPNPFRKQFGACATGCNLSPELSETRIFWCHICQRKFCWTCLKSHKD